MAFTVFARAKPFGGVDGPGGRRLHFYRCKLAWSVEGSTHEGLTAKQVAALRAEPSLEGILVFEEPAIDVDLTWDEIE